MKKSEQLSITLFLLCGALTYSWIATFQPQSNPGINAPTEGPRFSEEDGLHFLRQQWWDEIHQTQDDTDWRQLEYQTQWARFQEQQQTIAFRSEDCQLNLPGDLKGNWKEKGSNNQAGSVYQTEYEPETDEIWLLSAGGSLWKSKRQTIDWTVVNQNLQFDPGLLKFINYNVSKRLLALISRIPHYSDDRGKTWVPSQGITFSHSSGQVKDATVLNNSVIYILSQPSFDQPVRLHQSNDGGEQFQTLPLPTVTDMDRISLFLPFHSETPFVALKNEDNSLSIFRINPENNTLEKLTSEVPLQTGVIPVNLTGWHTDTLSRWYSYVEQNNELHLYQTDNQGQEWEDRGLLPAIPWEVGITVSPNDPDLLFLGEVECYRSENSGQDWELINPWYAYYNDTDNNLHADIMHFGEYTMTNDTSFMLISHHGGLSYSEDYFVTQQNLGKKGLNITQYYDTRTSPGDDKLVFAGSQDQGLQYNLDLSAEGKLPLSQFIPGDYDNLIFAKEGQSLWAVSPGGWVVHLDDINQIEVTATWSLPNFEFAVWLPPVTTIPNTEKSQILFGGGSVQQGVGAFLITLEANGNKIRAEQLAFDFFTNSLGGGISTLSVCPMTNKWYVATTNGRFFYSNDQGQNWISSQAGDQATPFYSLAILPSRQDPNVIYWAGSGYDQAAIYRSVNGGQNFRPFVNDLPPTVVFDLAANEDETLLFAATQAGPYVYSKTEGRWFDLAVPCSPVQTYLSVEYIASRKTARFSTFGRGIWDFQLDGAVPTRAPELEVELQVFPNPTSGPLQLVFGKEMAHPVRWALYNTAGQLLRKGMISTHQKRQELNVSVFSAGVYFLRLEGDGKVTSRKVVIK